MATPKSIHARHFYRCAVQRYEEGQHLVEYGYTTGAVYLAGYAIECLLKSLLLEATPSIRQQSVLESFRGQLAHSYDWLRERYLEAGGSKFTKVVAKHFTIVSTWTTALRYVPSTVNSREALEFVASTELIIRELEQRF